MSYEYNTALILDSLKKGIKIIPVKIDDAQIPSSLSGIAYVDFSVNREDGLNSLIKELRSVPTEAYGKLEWNKIKGIDFENLVSDLFLLEGFKIEKEGLFDGYQFDIIARGQNILEIEEVLLIECKFYQSNKISTDIIRQLIGVLTITKANKLILVTNSILTKSAREIVSLYSRNFIVWEEQTLLNKLYAHPELLKKYFGLKPVVDPTPVKLINEEFLTMQKLMYELDRCPEGKAGAKFYEDICIKILKYLFVPPLGEPKIQSVQNQGLM